VFDKGRRFPGWSKSTVVVEVDRSMSIVSPDTFKRLLNMALHAIIIYAEPDCIEDVQAQVEQLAGVHTANDMVLYDWCECPNPECDTEVHSFKMTTHCPRCGTSVQGHLT
jgi:hypothetical protein